MPQPAFPLRALRYAGRQTTEAWHAWFELAKILVPVSIATKLLKDTGLIEYLAVPLGPIMRLVGLPADMGLVWATAMVTNLYAAMVVFVELSENHALTVAQVTVLCAMMLVAHSLPVELRIAQKAGARLRAILALRLIGALVLGWLLHLVFSAAHLLQQPNNALWNPPVQSADWLAWAQGQARNLIAIYLIVLCLLIVMDVLRRTGLADLLTRALAPVLRGLGMSAQAAPLTLIGVLMGISYGGGLMLREARSGTLGRRDVFFAMALMGLAHSIVEDSLLMVLLGGHLGGTLVARFGFALVVMSILVRALRGVGDSAFERWLTRPKREAAGGVC
ncbi:MAG: hypothetical protein GF331_14120 [Chitinivibrionales bacterium]|nr:hypothetical protein [Chitinivibrionales bacterium]